VYSFCNETQKLRFEQLGNYTAQRTFQILRKIYGEKYF
jgi:hypothetical protein